MQKLKQNLKSFYPSMNQEVMEEGLRVFTEKKIKAHTQLLKIGSICNELYFMEEGTVKCSTINREGENQVLWVVFEDRFFVEPHSFFSQTPAQNNLILLEDSIVQVITYENFQNLLETYHEWALWLIRVLEYELCELLKDDHWQVQGDATEKYNRLLETYPEIVQKVPLGDIASLLGISQVSLSRIRASKQRKN